MRILRRHASKPLIEVRKLFRILLLGWWTANGDHHLKSLSLLTTPEGVRCLAPAYDLLSTRLALPRDRELALSVGGRKANLTRKTWLAFADYCGIAAKAAERLLAEQVKAVEPAVELIRRSFLPPELQEQYVEIVTENTRLLKA